MPVTEQALWLQGARIRDPIPHHVRLIELALREADQFDIFHFHLDHIHFPLVRRTRSVCLTTLHGRLDIPDLARETFEQRFTASRMASEYLDIYRRLVSRHEGDGAGITVFRPAA